jgi:hypothetical protein
MEKFEKFIKWFQHYGILKLLGAFVSLFLICWLFNLTDWNIFRYLIWIPGAYIIVTWITFVIDVIVRTRNERINAKSDLFDKVR